MKNRYDLEEKTTQFGEAVIRLCQSVRCDSMTQPIISQLMRSATSIGANYCEANGASSGKDFLNKIFICKKEAQETAHWFRMLIAARKEPYKSIEFLQKECRELILIFQKITSTCRKK
jgi:four helix bundle protein